MLTAAEIERDLFDQPERFKTCMRTKNYSGAKHIYDTARDVALFVQLEKEKLLELFGDRQQDPPVEGLFRETDVQKAYYEVAVKRQQEADQVRADAIARSRSVRTQKDLDALKRTLGSK